jgi:para-aminobenzoate synthetase component 1
VLEPIGFGFARSLGRYLLVRDRYPEAEMLLGIGNLTELTDADSAAINLLLLGFCEELSIRSVLTTEVISWASSCVRELDIARRLVHHAVSRRVLPKHLEPRLHLLRDAVVHRFGEERLAALAREIKDRNFRLFAEDGKLHVIRAGVHLDGDDPFELFARMGVEDASHAFYLGYELAKAVHCADARQELRAGRGAPLGFSHSGGDDAPRRRARRGTGGLRALTPMALLVSPAGSLPLVYALEPAPDAWLAFQSLADLRGALFLDSAAPDRFRGRHSYVTAAPFEMIRGGLDGVQVDAFLGAELADGGAPQRSTLTGDPFQIVQERLARFAAEPSAVAPPFQGGAAGLFGYGLSRVVEKLPPPARDEFGLPDLVLGLYDWVLAFDPGERRAFLVSQGFPAATEAERRLRASSRAEEVLMRLAAGEKAAAPALEGAPLAVGDLAPSHAVPGNSGLLSNFTPAGYVNAVRRAIEYVHAGDIFQVNISQRLLLPLGASPLEVYGRLRRGNPAPYAGYFHTGEVVIASCSPEQFLTLSGREVVTRPIKGTHPRGYTPEADSYGREALFESEKDRAENVMIVDLLRNDLSRVAKPGTVTVPHLFEIEGYPTVHHLVSEVRGELRTVSGPWTFSVRRFLAAP